MPLNPTKLAYVLPLNQLIVDVPMPRCCVPANSNLVLTGWYTHHLDLGWTRVRQGHSVRQNRGKIRIHTSEQRRFAAQWGNLGGNTGIVGAICCLQMARVYGDFGKWLYLDRKIHCYSLLLPKVLRCELKLLR